MKIIEASWEVCNKVGGIHTVITSKLPYLLEHVDSYLAIGPYTEGSEQVYKREDLPQEYWKAAEQLASEGIHIHYGTWLINGGPKIILIDLKEYWYKIDAVKKEFWDKFQVDSIRASYEYNEPLLWSYAVGRVVDVLATENVVLHAHEWLAGGAILACKNNPLVKTVFTTHATVLGRVIASNHEELYKHLNSIPVDERAYHYKVEAKHTLERAAARACDVFTTVSEITAMECEKMLGRDVDVVLPNGINIEDFAGLDQMSSMRKRYRRKLNDFLIPYFFPHYTFDLQKTMIYSLAGRYEVRDKGIDVYLESLGKLNQKLKGSDRTIVAFVWVPSATAPINPMLQRAVTQYEDIKDALDDEVDNIKQDVLYGLLEPGNRRRSYLRPSFISQMQKKKQAFYQQSNVPLSSHMVHSNDEVLRIAKENGLLNREEDRVKLVYYPIYLTGADGLVDLTYHEVMQASDLGIFPSYYEPWGYTPMEAAAHGVSSVTTDLSGFGQWVRSMGFKEGVKVISRLGKDDSYVVDKLSEHMNKCIALSLEDRSKDRIQAYLVAAKAGWRDFIKFHLQAYNK